MLDTKTFKKYQELIYSVTGISLREGKESLVSARVAKRMRALGIDSHDHYLSLLADRNHSQELTQFMDAISTNVTSFFREKHHFDIVDRLFARWLAEGRTRFRFWSAASSSGEEPYSLGMTLLERLAGRSVDLKILASDISTTVLKKAMIGEYDNKRAESIPPDLKTRYFSPEKGSWVVKAPLRDLITFATVNLSRLPLRLHGPFDVILCRNVMIYFDMELRERLVSEFHRLLRPGGFLMVGHAESLIHSDRQFKVVRPTVYCRK